MKVFITDGSYKQSLAAVRSLGRKGIHVIVGSHYKWAQCFWSKYCHEKLLYPDPRQEERFVDFMMDFVTKNKIDVLLPVGYISTMIFSKHKSAFSKYIRLPVADWEALEIAANKDKTMEFASVLGLAMPAMYKSADEIKEYPVVVKGIKESGHVRYVNSPAELAAIPDKQVIIQEYIPGDGFGLYALFDNGFPRAVFMHRRIREYPVTGGASSAAESYYDSALKEQGLKLLESLKWHGVAMVEFKKDSRDGKYKLMEINPKFWGSLDLSIAAGIDFPYLAAKMAYDGDIETVEKYRRGIRFRWPFPDDCLHLLAHPTSIGMQLCDFFRKDSVSNLSARDLKPHIIQFAATIRAAVKRIISGNLRYPHGRPRVRK